MPTQAEETQVKEFLRRAEVRTMKKDLLNLREADALKERYKIVNIKSLDEQRQEAQKKLEQQEKEKAEAEKQKREKVLGENAEQERGAEKQLKDYATEEERQQIFLLESHRLNFTNQILEIDNKKDPDLKLEKNRILNEKKKWEAKLISIKESVAKFDSEENFIDDKINQTTIQSERKSLEKRRWEIEDQRKETEKKTWEIESQLENINKKIGQIDKSTEQLVAERNDLNQKVLGVDKSLRDIYSGVIARVEEKRRGQAQEQKMQKKALAESRAEEKETIQRQQWNKSAVPAAPSRPMPSHIPVPIKNRIARTAETEEQQRKQFMQDVKSWSEEENK